MTRFRYRRQAGLAALAFAFGASLFIEGSISAAAASRDSRATRLAVAELPKAAEPTLGGAALSGKGASDDEPGCHRARKRLWVDGDGWIVRRVTTCR